MIIYEFEDETSSFDPKGHWIGGSEYYSRTHKCLLPNESIEWSDDEINKYIEDHSEDDNFWLE